MPRTLTAVLVTNDADMVERLEFLADGSCVVILGHTAYTSRGIRKLLRKPPRLVLCDGSAGEEVYIPYAKHLSDSDCRSFVVLLSSQTDISVLARAAVAGVAAVIPPLLPQAQLIESLTQISKGLAPETGKAFERIREELGIACGLAGRASFPGRRADQHGLIERCLRLGLSEAETAAFLGVDAADARRLVLSTESRQREKTPSRISASWGGTLAFVAAIALGLGFFAASASTPAAVPFRGRIAYEDSSPIPSGALRVEFWPINAGVGSGVVAHAVTDNVTGVFTAVTDTRGTAAALPRGRYRVTLLQSTGDAVPSSIIPGEYGDPSKSPLTCDPSSGITLLAVRRPASS
jgi:hypothetical protein